jgi:hypothetical protein
LASGETYQKGASGGSTPKEFQQRQQRNAGLDFDTTFADTMLGSSSVIKGGESDHNSEATKITDEEMVLENERTWTIVKTFDIKTESR